MIEGLTQGVRYGSSSHRLYFRLQLEGADVDPDSGQTPQVTLYNPSGTEIAAASDLTQVASKDPIWYKDVDASDTGVFEKGYNYRAAVSFVVDSETHEDHVLLDVVLWPFNDPLVSSEEIDEQHPEWVGLRPKGWRNWQKPIEQSHVELSRDLRAMRDTKGDPIYPNRIIDRGQLRLVEIAYVERVIADKLRMADETKAYYRQRAIEAFSNFNLFYVDADDDLVPDEDEERSAGPTFIR
jgi:hypothetical protein